MAPHSSTPKASQSGRPESQFQGRGVAPAILLDQIRNTVPFIFADKAVDLTRAEDHPFRVITQLTGDPHRELGHLEYFELCLSAHWTTVGSFVPTDVDNQIRFKLWHPGTKVDELERMAELASSAFHWNFWKTSRRWVEAPARGDRISGIHGEWFSVMAAAYGALRKKSPDSAASVAGLIIRELYREADIYVELKKLRDGVSLLKAATLIAHNLGDLDRVIEQWGVPEGDALREAVFKAGHEGRARFGGVLFEAGQLNKQMMSDENHRHFALRAARCLRRSPEFLLPVAPFFDNWGRLLAKNPDLRLEEIGEVVEALVHGWEKLPTTVAYARAAAGILDAFPGGFKRLSDYLPARIERTLRAGPLRKLIDQPQARFEEKWSAAALAFKPA